MTIVFLFFSLYFALFLRFNKRANGISPLLLISSFWLISIALSIWVYYYDLIPDIQGKITTFPYVFLIGCMIFSFSPFYRINFSHIRHIDSCNYEKLLYDLACILIICSFLPLIEHLFLIVQNNGTTINFQQQLSDTYEIKRESDINKLSSLARLMNGFLSSFRCVTIVLFFYFLGRKNYSRKFKSFLFFPILNSFLYNFLGASRAALFIDLANVILCFLMVQNTYSFYLQKIVKKILFLLIGSITSLLTIISTARYFFSSKDFIADSLFDWIAIYFGEATIRFNAQMWNIYMYMQGDNCFSFIKSLLGLPTFTDLLERRSFWTPRTNIPTHVFYTFIGDFYGDFGPLGCILILIFFISPFYFIIKAIDCHKDSIKFHHLIYVAIWGAICMYGFTYFLYKTFYEFRCFLVQISFALALSMLSKYSSEKD